jgi:hypothetical protein
LIQNRDVFVDTEHDRAGNYIPSMRKLGWIIPFALLLAACGAGSLQVASESERRSPQPDTESQPSPSGLAEVEPSELDPVLTPAPIDPALVNRRVREFDSYVPAQLIPLDGIAPVYDPEFALASEAPLLDDELIIGIELNGEAKAYPITVLRFREMVNDELGGLPILVTW